MNDKDIMAELDSEDELWKTIDPKDLDVEIEKAVVAAKKKATKKKKPTKKKGVRKDGKKETRGQGKRTDILVLEPGDNARFLKHSLTAFNLPPLDINDANAVEERIGMYFQSCIENDVKPGVAGLASYLGVNRQTLHAWFSGTRRANTPHADVIKKTYALLEAQWESYMQSGKMHPVAGIFLAKNNFNYQDKTEVEVSTTNLLGDEKDPEEIKRKYIAELTE